MANNQALIVLTPTGRRQTVKVTPNTTILQVLEDVCKKHELNMTEWDLKHYNRIIEVANSIRFSGLPNNATLEMVQSTKPRKESEINLGLQLECGKRLKSSFSPTESLWNILLHWENNGEPLLVANKKSLDDTGDLQPVCIYMRHEIFGEEELKRTTLRSLGLTHGSACIRLIHRSESQLKHQANVSAPLSRQTIRAEEDYEPAAKSTGISSEQAVGNVDLGGSDKRNTSPSPVPVHTQDEPMQVEHTIDLSQKKAERKVENAVQYESFVVIPEVRQAPEGHLCKLDERDGFLYFSGDVGRVETKVNDSFFDLTRSDVERRWRDLQVQRRQLEEAPLQIAEVRQVERDEARRRLLAEYPITHVRVRFPNRYVLQGTFSTAEKIGAVADFVRKYIADPNLSFYLLTTPPRTILSNDASLIDQNLVGSAVVYFGYDGQHTGGQDFIKPEIYQKLSDPTAIQEFLHNKHNASSNIVNVGAANEKVKNSHQPATSVTSNQPGPSQQSNLPSGSSSSKPAPSKKVNQNSGVVPKWFKK